MGLVSLNRDAVIRANAIVKPADFYAERHAIIWQAVTGCYERRIRPMYRRSQPRLCVRNSSTASAAWATVRPNRQRADQATNIEHYAAEVARTARLRALITIGGRIAQIGYNGDDDGAPIRRPSAPNWRNDTAANNRFWYRWQPCLTTCLPSLARLPILRCEPAFTITTN